MQQVTTIRIETATRKRIAKHGSKGSTYDEILNHILDEREKSLKNGGSKQQ